MTGINSLILKTLISSMLSWYSYELSVYKNSKHPRNNMGKTKIVFAPKSLQN